MFILDHLQSLFPYLKRSQHFWIAYSGGVDSHVLLHALATLTKKHPELFNKLHAIHINHGWHPNAETWAKHCVTICQRLGIFCEVIAVDAKPQKGQSREAIARNARYAAFAKVMMPEDCLLTAHQQNDQAETLLLQLFRGAGVKGLASMPKIVSFATGYHLRPLLDFSRAELQAYAEQQDLDWIEDESNININFDRNYIRHKVLPIIQHHWPAITTTLTRVANHCAEAETLLEVVANEDLHKLWGNQPNTLSVMKLLRLDERRIRNALRQWLRHLNLPIPSQTQLQRVQQDILHSKNDRCPVVTWDTVEIRRYRDDIYALLKQPRQDSNLMWEWNLEHPLILPGIGVLTAERIIGKGIRCEIFSKNVVSVRFRQQGERCQPSGRSGSHPLKKLLQEWHVPPWERSHIPLIYHKNQLIAVVDYCVCEPFAASTTEPGWLISLHAV